MMMLGLNAFAQKIVLTPQWTAQSQFAGYYVAKEMGFYKEAGVDVDIRHMTTSEIALNRLQDDKCNAITMMLFDAIYHVSRGVEIVNILQTAQRSGHVIVVRDDEIKDVKDLKGKRFGVWRRNFNQLLRIIDEEVLLGVEWVPFVQSINLYISGAVDATMAMTYNEIYHINASGYEGKTVISMAELGYDYPEDGLYVTREYYEKYPDKAQAFADASRRGWEWAHEHPEETLDIVLKVMEREHLPSSRKHQEWMLREILNQQCAEGESTPSFTLDPDIYSKLNELFIRHSRIEDEVSIDKIQGR
jgi:NitT/TauT family transport system substrate-binding protein